MLLLHDEFKLTEKDIRLFFWSTIEIVIIIILQIMCNVKVAITRRFKQEHQVKAHLDHETSMA